MKYFIEHIVAAILLASVGFSCNADASDNRIEHIACQSSNCIVDIAATTPEQLRQRTSHWENIASLAKAVHAGNFSDGAPKERITVILDDEGNIVNFHVAIFELSF